MTQTRVCLWTLNEYHRMFETGIITEDQRVELIDGQVIPMSAKNPLHAATTLCAFDYLKRWRSPPQASLVEVALVRVQNPIQLSQYSEPEPDIAKILLPHSPTGHNTPIFRHPTHNCNSFLLNA
ncbi:Uma2 family endonuclease [Nostoc sp.]|uniref:Uma2 family endonuclease n=1 Tax=Nostoc sp. TaxID=1180 RepID=UPI002FFAC4C1